MGDDEVRVSESERLALSLSNHLLTQLPFVVVTAPPQCLSFYFLLASMEECFLPHFISTKFSVAKA